MARVFLSYKHVEPDQSIAKFIYRYLVDRDHDVFFDSVEISVGKFWHKEIKANLERAEYFVPLVSLAYVNSPYILEYELSAAARLLKAKKIHGILQVNLAFDGTPPHGVKDVIDQIQFLKWRSPDDTPELVRALADALPTPRLLVKGMRSFTTADGPQFLQLGREQRVSEFVGLLNQATNRLTLLHGVSGSGKTSFIQAGVLPIMRDQGVDTAELERDTPEELDALLQARGGIIILDQFEQSLVRLSRDKHSLGAFVTTLESRLKLLPTLKLVFCIRDEYRTAFDTMLPNIASQCALFPLLPLDVDTAANVLALMLENVHVPYDTQFLPALCALLAEGVPRTLLPALLQIAAQHFQNNNLRLNGGTWDRLLKPGNSLFEQHVSSTLLGALPLSVSRLDACRSLTALTSGNAKSSFKPAPRIAEDSGVNQLSVQRTMDIGALPISRIVTVEVDSQLNTEQYRLAHDLFASAVQSLARRAEGEKARRNRSVFAASLAFSALMVVATFYFLYRNAEDQKRIANSQRLAVTAQLNRSDFPDRALLLGIEAYKTAPTFEALNTLLTGLQSSPGLLTHLYQGAPARSVAFSSDGKTLAASSGKIVRLWDVAKRQPIGEPLQGHTRTIENVAFSPDGKILASACDDSTVRLWDTTTYRPLGEPLRGHRGFVLTAVFSPDGKTLASASDDNTVRLWDVAKRQQVGEPLEGQTGRPRTLAFSPDGKMLALGTVDGTLELWDMERWLPIPGVFPAHLYGVNGVAFSPDSKMLASASSDKTVRLWNVATRKPIGEPLQGHKDEVWAVTFSPDGSMLASSSSDKTVRIWEVATGQPIAEPFQGHTSYVRSAAFSPDSKTLASASDDGSVNLWDVTARQRLGDSLGAETDHQCTVAISPDGTILASGSVNGTIQLWNVTTRARSGKPLRKVTVCPSVAFSANGRLLAFTSWQGTIELWDVATRQPLGKALEGFSFAFSPDAKVLAASSSNLVRLWDVTTRQPLGEPLREEARDGCTLAFSVDGKTLGCASHSTVQLWDVATRRSSVVTWPDSHEVASVVLSADLKMLAAAYENNTIQLWDVATRRSLGEPLQGHKNYIASMAFSPDGRLLASASADRTLRLWDVATRQPLGEPLQGNMTPVMGVAFGPNGKILASAGDTLRLWSLDLDYWADRTCSIVNRNLSMVEWQQYMGMSVPYQKTCAGLPPGKGAREK